MIVLSAGPVILEQLLHCTGAQVFIDLGVTVEKDLCHFVAYGTAKPVIHDIHSEPALWPL